MTQYGLPISDYAAALNWVEGAGDADGAFYDELDEGFGAGRGSGVGPDDATTYWLTTDEAINNLRSLIDSVNDPGVHTGHKYRTRNRKNPAGGRQIDIQIRMYELDIARCAYATFANVDTVWTTREDTLTEAEAGAITDYSDLVVRTYVADVGGGSPRVGWESAHEFECPDAGAPAYYHGLKVQGEGELALCDVGSHPLRIRKGGTTYGIELVDVSDPNASRVRIKTPAGVKAIRKYT